MQKILVPYDGSAPAKRAVRFRVDSFNVNAPIPVQVLNVQEIPVLTYGYVDAALTREIERESLAQGQKLLLR